MQSVISLSEEGNAGRAPCDDGVEMGGDQSRNKGIPGMPGNHHKL